MLFTSKAIDKYDKTAKVVEKFQQRSIQTYQRTCEMQKISACTGYSNSVTEVLQWLFEKCVNLIIAITIITKTIKKNQRAQAICVLTSTSFYSI